MTTRRTDDPAPLPDDARLEAAWRAASREEPPAALDAAIRAEARRAVEAKPRPAAVPESTSPERWWWPLAAAATIGAVAVGILQIVGPGEPDHPPAVVSDMPVSPVAAPVPPLMAPPPGLTLKPDDAVTRKSPPASRAPAAASATPAAPAAARDRALPAPAMRAMPDAGLASRAARTAPLSVNDWVVLIRRLRAEGRHDEATKEAAAFRAAHPDLDLERLLAEK